MTLGILSITVIDGEGLATCVSGIGAGVVLHIARTTKGSSHLDEVRVVGDKVRA